MERICVAVCPRPLYELPQSLDLGQESFHSCLNWLESLFCIRAGFKVRQAWTGYWSWTKSVKCQVVDWNEKQERFDICHFLSTHFKLIRTNRNAQWADVSRQRNQNETTKSNLREGSRCWSRNISKKIKIEKQALWRDVAFLGKVWNYVKMSTQKKLKYKRVKLSV